MPKLPRGISAAEMVRALMRNGFVRHRQQESHLTLRRLDDDVRVVVPMHPGDLPVRLVHKILKQAGLTPDIFS